MMNFFASSQLNIDLAEICCNWYRKPPLKMKKSITIGDGTGNFKEVPLKSFKITGNW